MVFYTKSQGVYLTPRATPFYVITIFILQNGVTFCFYSSRNLCLLNTICKRKDEGVFL